MHASVSPRSPGHEVISVSSLAEVGAGPGQAFMGQTEPTHRSLDSWILPRQIIPAQQSHYCQWSLRNLEVISDPLTHHFMPRVNVVPTVLETSPTPNCLREILKERNVHGDFYKEKQTVLVSIDIRCSGICSSMLGQGHGHPLNNSHPR